MISTSKFEPKYFTGIPVFVIIKYKVPQMRKTNARFSFSHLLFTHQVTFII